MKTKLISLAIAASFALLITGCGGAGNSSINNEILNKLPSIAKDYEILALKINQDKDIKDSS